MRKNATLVWSAKPNNNPYILVYSLDESISSFVDAIFSSKKRKLPRTDRLVYRNGNLYYNASEEYRAYVVRMKKIR